MSEFSLSGSQTTQTPDCGDKDPYQVLEELRYAAMENVARERTAIAQETARLQRELNEMRRDSGEAGPLPLPEKAGDIEKWAEDIQESTALNKASICKLEGDLHEARINCRITKQRVQVMLKDLAEVNQMCDKLINFSHDSDDDEEELGGAGDAKDTTPGQATAK